MAFAHNTNGTLWNALYSHRSCLFLTGKRTDESVMASVQGEWMAAVEGPTIDTSFGWSITLSDHSTIDHYTK